MGSSLSQGWVWDSSLSKQVSKRVRVQLSQSEFPSRGALCRGSVAFGAVELQLQLQLLLLLLLLRE